ncbi:S26 family signal peptidase [Streptacidiphilus monticola]
MGDHRDVSADSRFHMREASQGFVPESDVVGRAVAVVWPVGRWRALHSDPALSVSAAELSRGPGRGPRRAPAVGPPSKVFVNFPRGGHGAGSFGTPARYGCGCDCAEEPAAPEIPAPSALLMTDHGPVGW